VRAAVRPVVSSFPEVTISKGEAEYEWPFSVDEGTLTCVAMGNQRVAIFSEPWREDLPQEFGNMTLPRSVIVSANPIALFAGVENRDLYAPYDGLETLIKRLAPYERMGWALCEQSGDKPQQEEL
jgi:hypothetical protein